MMWRSRAFDELLSYNARTDDLRQSDIATNTVKTLLIYAAMFVSLSSRFLSAHMTELE